MLLYDNLNPSKPHKFRTFSALPATTPGAPGLLRSGSLQIRNLTRGTALGTRIDVADTSQKRRTGLLRHTHLAEGEGLLISPCEGVHTFGMKFPIDVVYVNRQRIVVKLRPDMARGRISLCLSAHSVIELPVGAIQASKTERGDQLAFEQ